MTTAYCDHCKHVHDNNVFCSKFQIRSDDDEWGDGDLADIPPLGTLLCKDEDLARLTSERDEARRERDLMADLANAGSRQLGDINADLAAEYLRMVDALRDRQIVRGIDVRHGDPFGMLLAAFDEIVAERDALKAECAELRSTWHCNDCGESEQRTQRRIDEATATLRSQLAEARKAVRSVYRGIDHDVDSMLAGWLSEQQRDPTFKWRDTAIGKARLRLIELAAALKAIGEET